MIYPPSMQVWLLQLNVGISFWNASLGSLRLSIALTCPYNKYETMCSFLRVYMGLR